MKRVTFKLSLSLLVLLAALVWFSPPQPALADAPVYTITASSGSSVYHTDVSFTVSATGSELFDGTPTPPYGYVRFYDGVYGSGGTLIFGCEQVALNYLDSQAVAGLPAICTTSNLAPGTHTITALFISVWPGGYSDTTLTLPTEHVVTVITLTIEPDTLPDGVWGTYYSQQLTASPGTEPYLWGWTADGPAGVVLYANLGQLEGAPTEVGTFTLHITVEDTAGGLGTKDYTLTVNKAVPQVTVTELTTTEGSSIWLQAMVRYPDRHYTVEEPSGSISFSVDDVPVPGCSGAEAVPIYSWGGVQCSTYTATGLSGGDHTISAEYLPDDASKAGYATTTGTGTLHVLYSIGALLFKDADRDGSRDTGEPYQSYFNVFLDKDCDGTAEQTQVTSWDTGEVSFTGTPGAQYCVRPELSANWIQTTTLELFTLNANKYLTIGVFKRELTFNPLSGFSGEVGVAFDHVITVSGGTAPYAFTFAANTVIPDGVSSSVDVNAGTITLSGTPTRGGIFMVVFDVRDADGVFGTMYYGIGVTADGSFSLTSSLNPSASGEPVTFTLSATGNARTFSGGTVPPYGTVTFYDNDVEIAGCKALLLNRNPGGTPSIGDYPALCTTSALADGKHTIKAAFSSSFVYRDANPTLQQRVGADSTPPDIVSNVAGTLGENGWYTSNVILTWTVTEPESQVTSSTGCDEVTITTDQNDTKYTCSATSEGGTNSVDVTIKRDANAPSLSVTGVTDGSEYAQGSVPQAGCSTEHPFGSIPIEAKLSLTGGDPQGFGDITATCSGAVDHAGNTAKPAVVRFSVLAPTGVNVTGFAAKMTRAGGLALTWRSTSESQLAGFNVYRRVSGGAFKKINAGLIEAKHGGDAAGAGYRFVDKKVRADKTYRYKLEVIYLDNHSEWTNVIRIRTH